MFIRIVFGWRYFKLKSFTPTELGLPNPKESNFAIELRQGYFHLFYIPFLSIGQKWNIRKGGKLYETPAPVMEHIHQRRVSARTPWYTFAGPILIVAGFAIYGFNEKIDSIRADKRMETNFEAKAARLTEQLAKTDDHDYYWLKDMGASGSIVLLKVAEVKGDDITCSMLTTGLSDYEITPLKMQYLFALKGSAAEKITLSRQKMLAAIPRKYQDANKGTDVLGNGRLYTAGEIYHLDGPMLVDRNLGYMSRTNIRIDILNLGWPGTLTKITNLSGGYKWTNQVPHIIPSSQNDYDYNGQFHLIGSLETTDRKYKVELTIVDSLQKEHKYIVEGEGFANSVKQIN
jgi:hypothetical protein